ncbi:MAG: DUF5996 family protein [Acidimicrobiia bacterium]|nr:DUF5996 family protein [Acidimicrobiia bacterium]
MSDNGHWPSLPSDDWADTIEAFHLFSQIVGKIRMVQSPWLNHSWSVPLYVGATGLGTTLIPYGSQGLEMAFDLHRGRLEITTTKGDSRSVPLSPGTVADFYAAVMEALDSLDMPVTIHRVPSEIPNAVPFDEDNRPLAFDIDQVRKLWHALVHGSRVMGRFRAGFRGKSSPVHFFWGSFDLAVTRFSGRTAPAHPGGIPNFPLDVAQEAYSHEVTSAGFWPGNREAPDPIFYSYAYPIPEGFESSPVEPAEAFWLSDLGEFVLPYAAVAEADDPDGMLLAFFETTHAAAADLAGWDRAALECADPHGPDWWRDRPHA